MRTALLRSALLAAASTALAGQAGAQLRLTDVVVNGSNAYGTGASSEVWDTQPGGNANVYLSTKPSPATASDFLNPQATLDHGLDSSQLYTFYLRSIQAFDSPYYALSLFFDGSKTAGLQAVVPFNCPAGMPGCESHAVGPSSVTLDNKVVTFKSFSWGKATDDRVGVYSTGADGSNDYAGVVQFEVQGMTPPVTTTPEPATVGLLGAGLAGIGAAVRRRRAARA